MCSLLKGFMNIHIIKDELVLDCNLIFMQVLKKLPKKYRPHDALNLFIYLGAFDEEGNYQLRNENPRKLHEAFKIAMKIEMVLRYGVSTKLKPKR